MALIVSYNFCNKFIILLLCSTTLWHVFFPIPKVLGLLLRRRPRLNARVSIRSHDISHDHITCTLHVPRIKTTVGVNSSALMDLIVCC